MTVNLKKILIVSFYFPPSSAIGGRRWAKFAKYLKLSGNQVFVIAAHSITSGKSLWSDDISTLDIRYIQSRYPRILLTVAKTIAGKLQYRFWKILLNLFSKGTIYDHSIFWKKNFEKIAIKKIKYDLYNNIIVNGPPHMSSYFSVKLKEKFPELNVIVDFRDPWTWWNNMGYNTLSAKRLKYELSKEQYVVNNANYILMPSEAMKKILVQKYPGNSHKFIVIPHGYDEMEMNKIILEKQQEKKSIRIIYGGTLYVGIENHLKTLIQSAQLAEVKITIDFFSLYNKYPELIRAENNCYFYDAVNSSTYLTEVSKSDYVLAFAPDDLEDFIGSKFFEIIYLKKPIIYIGKKGMISDFLENNRLGVHILPDNDQMKLANFFNSGFEYNHKFEIHQYSFSELSKKIESLIV